MIVYGDAQFRTTAGKILVAIERRLRATDPFSLDDLRTLLIQAGQLEQALVDRVVQSEQTSLAERFTDAVGAAFVHHFLYGANTSNHYRVVESAFAQLNADLADSRQPLTVKIPEGFEFYNLFPEQYCATTRQWATPGNKCLPGPQGSATVLERWAKTRRCFTPPENILWHGSSLREELLERSAELLGNHAATIDDLSAGAWREHTYADQTQWPAVAALFERAKFKVTSRSGAALLWKFTGFGSLGAVPIPEQLSARARLGWTPAPLATCLGFTATRWIEGKRLTSTDATPAVLTNLAPYIAETTASPLENSATEAALERLIRMARHNGEELGLSSDTLQIPRAGSIAALPCYGDGRMAPHEWIWTNEARLIKTDAHDHSCDHTIIGRQPFLWDVAGVIVEWDLSPEQIEQFLGALETLNLPSDHALEFYVRSYAIFRAGLMLFASESADPAETKCLHAAANRYRDHVSFGASKRRKLAAT